MWTVVYIAPHKKAAEKLKDVLMREGLLVQLRPVGLPHDNGAIEILVPESEAEEALEIINENVGIR